MKIDPYYGRRLQEIRERCNQMDGVGGNYQFLMMIIDKYIPQLFEELLEEWRKEGDYEFSLWSKASRHDSKASRANEQIASYRFASRLEAFIKGHQPNCFRREYPQFNYTHCSCYPRIK